MSDENTNETPVTPENTETSKKKPAFTSFLEKLRSAIDSGVEVSKKGISSAGSAISDFGDKSVLRIELSQLNGRAEKIYAQLGKYAVETFLSQENSTLSAGDEKINSWLTEIKDLRAKIQEKEKALNPPQE